MIHTHVLHQCSRRCCCCCCACCAPGKEFDDEGDDYGTLHRIASLALGQEMDRSLLKRMVRAYISLPFGGFI